MKNPNGYGSIVKLPGKRRNPYAVRVTTSIGLENGQFRQKRKYVGYYPTKKEALRALEEYHQHPDMMLDHATFAEIYERWSDEHFPNISDSLCRSYRAAYRAVPGLHQKKFAELQPVTLQNAIDESGKSANGQRRIIGLLSQMYQYAAFYRIIPTDVNPAHLLHAKKIQKSNMHHRFNGNEVEVLWDHSRNEYIQMILMLIYSGVRPGELFDLKSEDVHLGEQFFYIRAGKNESAVRVVPIADKVLPFFQNWMKKKKDYLITVDGEKVNFQNHIGFINHVWKPTLEPIGIYQSKDVVTGEMFEHKPHDCRHTFASMWADAQLDEKMRRRIMGHSGQGIGEAVYTHFDLQKMLAEINKL